MASTKTSSSSSSSGSSSKRDNETQTRQLPVRLDRWSVLDREFESMRDRFDAEMADMERQMDAFRDEVVSRQLANRAHVRPKKDDMAIATRLMERSSRSRFESVNGRPVVDEKESQMHMSSDGMLDDSSGLVDHRHWLSTLDSPLIHRLSPSSARELKLRFDLSDYEPDQIVVKTVDSKLVVQARHEEAQGERKVLKEYNREFLLPEGTDPDTIRSSLSKDGVLTVEAPLPNAENALK